MEAEQHAAQATAKHVDAERYIRTPDGYMLQTQDWGWTVIPFDMVEDLASFTGRSQNECVERLGTYSSREMGDEWQKASPKTPEEMRRFYSTMDLYLWDLSIWHASLAYKPYLGALDRLASLQGSGCKALDYGSGIGTAALKLAGHRYDITIADVPGITFDYAQYRLKRRGISFKALPIDTDLPAVKDRYDAIICLDVLEHVPNPDRVFKHLMRLLTPRGIANIVASYDAQPDHAAYHLRENYLRWGRGRWPLFMSGCGFYDVGDSLYVREAGAKRIARTLHYALWRMTGFDIRYKTRMVRS